MDLLESNNCALREIFEEVVEYLRDEYKEIKERFKNFIKNNNTEDLTNVGFEEFCSYFIIWDEFKYLKASQKAALYDYIMKPKLKEKDKDKGYQTESMAVSKLKSYLNKKRISPSSSEDEILSLIKETGRFSILSRNKIISIYQSYQSEQNRANKDINYKSEEEKEDGEIA